MHQAKGYTYQIPANSRFATLMVFSEGGYIEVTHSQGYDAEQDKYFVERRSFRPDAPSFNSFNRVAVGNMLIKLNDGSRTPKVINISFANVSTEAVVTVGFAMAFDMKPLAGGTDLTDRVEFPLQLHSSVSCHLVLVSSP